jgi:hypothetical protein
MLNLTHAVLCSTLSLGFSAIHLGQRAKGTTPPQSNDRIKVEDIHAGVPSHERAPVKKVGQAEVEYFDNETLATVSLPNVYRQGKNLISLRATIISPGQQLRKPDFVQLIIYFPSNFTAINGNPDLTVRYDEGQESTGATRRNSQAMVNIHGSYAGLLRQMDYDSFRRMAESKRVVLQLGEFKFALSEKQLRALRDLLIAIEQ